MLEKPPEVEKEKVGFAAPAMENLPGHDSRAVRQQLCVGFGQT
jgi:hypothetical protein